MIVKKKTKTRAKKTVKKTTAKKAVKKTVKRKTAKKTVKKTTAKKTIRKTAKKAKRKTSGRKSSGLTKMSYSLSDELQAIVGCKTATRPEIVKKLWAYIKSHKCQDAQNRRMINPDAKLAKVIGSRSVDMMKLAGCLSKHIK